MRTTILSANSTAIPDILRSLRHADATCIVEIEPSGLHGVRLVIRFSRDVLADELHKRNLVPSDSLQFEGEAPPVKKPKPRRDAAALAALEF